MKITYKEFNKFKALYKKDVVGISINLDDAEVYFEKNTDESDEFVFLPKLNAIGMSIILDYLEKKHNKPTDIVPVDCSFEKNNLKEVLDTFSKMEEGSKLILVVYDGTHWRTAYCERKNNKSYIAAIDSCGIKLASNPLEKVVNDDPFLKQNCILYRSVNMLQTGENNCGIFSIKIAKKLNQETNFFEKLEKGKLILTKEEANEHFRRSKQLKSDKQCDIPTDNFFVLPPEYFSLAQKKSYLKHYKDEFGTRSGISEFKGQSKTGATVLIEDLFNKKTREDVLSNKERTLNYLGSVTNVEDHNVNVLYFSNKYIEAGIFNLAMTNKEAHPNLDKKARKKLLQSKAESRLSHTEEGKKHLAAVAKPCR